LLHHSFFSTTLARLYSQDIFLFFSDPKGDDESYFEHLNVWFSGHTYGMDPTENCRSPRNFRGMGSAVLWTPGYLLFKYGGQPLKDFLSQSKIDDLSWERLGAATMNFPICACLLFLSYSILSRYIGQRMGFIFSFVTIFGHLLPYYLFRRPLMSHAAEVFYFLLTVEGIERLDVQLPSKKILFWIGLSLGGLLSTRLQDIGVVGIIFLGLLYLLRHHWRLWTWLGIPFFLFLIPQLYINQLNFGHWLVPSSAVIPFMTPTFSFQFGIPQLKRLIHLFIGQDWGLLWMFPWLLFAFFVSKEQLKRIKPVSWTWIIGSLLCVPVMLNYKAHGASYGHRYVTLFIEVMGFFAALGFDRLRKTRFRLLVYLLLTVSVGFSLLHFVAFESDSRDLTQVVDHISLEGPVRREWLEYSPIDWVNGRYSVHVYRLLLHPKILVQKFGSAPLPLYISHRLNISAAEAYIDKHQIDFESVARYYAFVFLLMLIESMGVVWFLSNGEKG